MRPLPLPVAVHIGYRKTGSSWLQRIAFPQHRSIGAVPSGPLAEDPGPALAILRELIVTPDWDYDPERTRAAIAAAAHEQAEEGRELLLVTAERLSGHGASGGLDAAGIARRLHAAAPEAKVFWFVRSQPSALRSEYKQLIREGWGGTVEQTFAPPPRWRTPGFDLAHWEYDHLVAVYQELFGPTAVRVLDHRCLRSDPGSALDELAAFLGIEPWRLSGEQLAADLNASKSDRWIRGARVLNHFRRTELNPDPLVELSPTSWLRLSASWSRLAPVVERLPDKALFPPDFDARIEARFADSNKRLAELTGIEL